jgi:hemerythrin superfamily protein
MPTKTKQLDITELLHNDHQTVRELFFAFSKAEEESEKSELVQQILTELYIHAKVEEEIVYPLLDDEGEDGEEFKGEAENEHLVVKYLMAEISQLEAGDDELKAKMTVLCELVEHHVKEEEEKEMFEMLRESGNDLAAIAEEANERKAELKKEGLPAMKATLAIGDEIDADDDEDEDAEDELSASKRANKGIKAKAAPGSRKAPAQKPRRKTA